MFLLNPSSVLNQVIGFDASNSSTAHATPSKDEENNEERSDNVYNFIEKPYDNRQGIVVNRRLTILPFMRRGHAETTCSC